MNPQAAGGVDRGEPFDRNATTRQDESSWEIGDHRATVPHEIGGAAASPSIWKAGSGHVVTVCAQSKLIVRSESDVEVVAPRHARRDMFAMVVLAREVL